MITRCALIVLFAFLSACSIPTVDSQTDRVPTLPNSGEPPEAAVRVAVNALQRRLLELSSNNNSFDPELIHLERYRPIELNRADLLNLTTEKWCIGLSYIKEDLERGVFSEFGSVYLVWNDGQEWLALQQFTGRFIGSPHEEYEASWGLCLLN